ncbi:MAG: membrane protein containing DUF1119, archaea [Candidatus Syntrophoarchaeum butanivorans]|uniref:Membrane protein containing DUF1119, archaea n=2 Tax=Candidatus Syntropharchaeum butanivorans TaxID=1839936 RepID=A0A1F2P5T1_9EURY|nr:MAG: membrane protein containing DUF1119, archaea [Candidatus Syntrophoarchaeum butanivorans]
MTITEAQEDGKDEGYGRGGILPLIVMGSFILIVQLVALILAGPFESAGIKAFEDPDSVVNPIIYIAFILLFTLFILLAMRRKRRWLVNLIMYGAIFGTLCYVFILPLPPWGALPLSLILTALIYVYPEWYIIDAVGLVIAAGATSIFGISLAVIPAIVLLAVLAVYDAISVYRTRHMVALAEGVLDLRIPILFILPRRKGFSFLRKTDLKQGDAFIMGLGDAIIPSILVISANVYIKDVPVIWILNLPALGAMIGTLLGYITLSRIVGKGKPHAGLPLLNTGAILGFLVGFFLSFS